MKIMRQGDIVFLQLSSSPALEAGEKLEVTGASGNVHVLAPCKVVRPLQEGTARVAVPEEGAVVSHPEHQPLHLPPGGWEVRVARRYQAGYGD